MNRDEMNTIVGEELEHIPRGDNAQNLLRFLYNMVRRRDLKHGKPVEESLGYCISKVKEYHPDWEPIIR